MVKLNEEWLYIKLVIWKFFFPRYTLRKSIYRNPQRFFNHNVKKIIQIWKPELFPILFFWKRNLIKFLTSNLIHFNDLKMTLIFLQNVGGGSFIILLLFFILPLSYFVLWLYCLIDVIRSKFKTENMKLIWIIILVFVQLIGPILYLILRKNSKLITWKAS
jgi:hypothetical protein